MQARVGSLVCDSLLPSSEQAPLLLIHCLLLHSAPTALRLIQPMGTDEKFAKSLCKTAGIYSINMQ